MLKVGPGGSLRLTTGRREGCSTVPPMCSKRRSLLVVFLITAVSLGLVTPADAGTSSSGDATLIAQDGWASTADCLTDYDFSMARYRLAVDETQIPDFESWSADVTIQGPGFDATYLHWNDFRGDEDWQDVYLC